jgi:mono/diheme cytochrome c family protein
MRRWLCAVLCGNALAGAHAADTAAGQALYRTHCESCHGPGGRPVLPGAPDLSRPTALLRPDLAIAATIRSGKAGMPGYAGQLRDREILDLVAHMRTFR